jgi:DNA-binding transcriptional LysR family regulator
MNLNHLFIFHTVAEEGSISRAAERLFISQPAVSKQLAEFEKSFGARLCDRLPRGIRLTEAGRVMHDYSRKIFALEQEAERALSDLQGLQRGRLSIGASTTIGVYLLPGIMTAFRQRYPQIELHLEIANTDRIRQLLSEGLIDVGFTEGFADSPELESEAFLEDELVAIASPQNPIHLEASITLERLCQEPFVVREDGSGMQAVIDRALEGKGMEIRPAMTLGSTEAVKRAVTMGAGVAIVSRLTIGLERQAGKLLVLPVKDFSLHRSLHRIQVRGRHEPPTVRAFRERMQRSLRSQSWRAYHLI